MHKINKITIQGFRRLRDVSIEMRPFMVMIGANGVGKTSLLDAISLLSATAAGRLNQTLRRLGGFDVVRSFGSLNGIGFGAEMALSDHAPLEYWLNLEKKNHTYAITQESLTQQERSDGGPFKHLETIGDDVKYYHPEKRGLFRPDWDHSPMESALAQIPKMFRQAEDFRRVLSSVTQYHVLDVGDHAPVKLAQQVQPVNLPGANGEDLISFLFNLRESDRDRYEVIEDSLRAAFPGFESMSFPPVAAGMLSLTWKEKYFKHPLYIHQLSEGTLRFLWLVSLLQSPGLSTVTMVDEPEVSLHPELLSLLAELMREASKSTQMIVATHSDRFIRFLQPHEVLVLDVDDDGYTRAVWGDTFDLDEWLKEYSLDEVWRMGRMGGRS